MHKFLSKKNRIQVSYKRSDAYTRKIVFFEVKIKVIRMVITCLV